MKAELLKMLRNSFQERLKKLCPLFIRITKPGYYYWRDEWVFLNNQCPLASSIIILSPNPNGSNSFCIELGWSRKCRLPELTKRPSSIAPRTSEKNDDEYITRLSYLKNPTFDFYVLDKFLDDSADDLLSRLSRESAPFSVEQAYSIVNPVLDNAMYDLEHSGLAYLTDTISAFA